MSIAEMIRRRRGRKLFCAGVVAIASIGSALTVRSAHAESLSTPTELGRALFGDRNLSFSRKQNCISCHSPELAFTDPRALGKVQGAVSRGGDGHSLGDRNSPTLAYAMLTPAFHVSAEHGAVGGMFWDGRARNIEDQAHSPILNPLEMAMPDEESVVARLRENADYKTAFPAFFGPDVLKNTPKAMAALGTAMAAYLQTPEFAPFDSKYDRSLRGEVALSASEAKGRDLFFSKDGAGCSRCHSSAAGSGEKRDAFTNFRYYNLGVPKNITLRSLNGSDTQRVDHGLQQNPNAKGSEFDGKFKVPTLRNVAVTGPYMHNGVFQDLRTAILFHQRFSNDGFANANPETGTAWALPEDGANVASEDLKTQTLSATDVDAMIAFLNVLTDQRYVSLLAN